MIARLARRLLCRAGHHDPVRCAGANDHAWTWRDGAWRAEIVRPLPWLTPSTRRLLDPALAPDQAVHAPRPPAGKNDHGADCRCGHQHDQHRPVSDGGCTACPCYGYATTTRQELEIYRLVTGSGPRHRSDS